MKKSKYIFDTQIIFSQISPELDVNTLQKNFDLFTKHKENAAMLLPVFCELLWLFFRRTYKNVDENFKKIPVKDAIKDKKCKALVRKEFWDKVINFLNINKIYLIDSQYSYDEIVDMLTNNPIDPNDILILVTTLKNAHNLISGDENLNILMKKLLE